MVEQRIENPRVGGSSPSLATISFRISGLQLFLFPERLIMSNGLKPLFDLFIKEKRYLANLAKRTLGSYKEVFARYEKYSDSSQLPTDKLSADL